MKIGIVGFGSLGRALAEGLTKSGVARGDDICVCDSAPEARALASGGCGTATTEDINEAIGASDVVFLVVKSHVFEALAPSVDRSLLAGKTVVSFMAGVTIDRIRDQIGDGAALVRGMPSLAIAVCDGVVAYTAAPAPVTAIFHSLGYAFETAPEDIEKVMAFSACGLGFAAYLIDAFADAGAALGFGPDICREIASRTFQNAVDRGDWKSTVSAVATKGGATEQGVLHMDACGVRDSIAGAVLKAYERMK